MACTIETSENIIMIVRIKKNIKYGLLEREY